MQEENDHLLMRQLLEKNTDLLEENNRLLKQLYKWSIFNGVLRVLWYVVLIGLPFALYFYLLEPYFSAFGSNYETFESGVGEIPAFKAFSNFISG